MKVAFIWCSLEPNMHFCVRHPDTHPDTHPPTVDGMRPLVVLKGARHLELLRAHACGTQPPATRLVELQHLAEGTPLGMPHLGMEGPLPVFARIAGTRRQRRREVCAISSSVMFYLLKINIGRKWILN